LQNSAGVPQPSKASRPWSEITIWALCSLAGLGYESQAHALGFIRLDSQSFFKSSGDRATSTATLAAGPDLQSESRLISTRVKAQAIGFLTDPSSFTFEANEAFLATSPQLWSDHQVTLGRKTADWSITDDIWRMGLWNSRFTWDPLRPETVGLIGAFYKYERSNWRVLAHLSPMAVPERGYVIREDMTSASPDAPPQATELFQEMSGPLPIRYSIAYPSMSELLFRPTGAISVRYGAKDGAWGSIQAGVMPVSQPILYAEPQLNPHTPIGSLDITIHPTTLSRQIVTAEAGYRGREWNLWASATQENPLQTWQIPSNWLGNAMGPATILSTGAKYQLASNLNLTGSFLSVSEDTSASPSSNDTTVNIPSRFFYTRAAQVGSHYSANDNVAYQMNWTFDLAKSSNFMALDFVFAPPRKPWLVGLGADVFTTSTGTGTIGQYQGNDRVRARVSYAF